MDHGATTLAAGAALAAALGLLAHDFAVRRQWPLGVVLTLLGVGLASGYRLLATLHLLPLLSSVQLSGLSGAYADGLLLALLPPLIFEASFKLETRALRRDGGLIVLLATVGVALTAVLVAWPLAALGVLPLWTAVVFGALIAATDPVAALAVLGAAGVPKRLLTLLEGESLVNDGTAIVLYGTLVTAALAPVPPSGGLVLLTVARVLLVAAGGVLVGLLTALAARADWSRTKSLPTRQLATTAAAAYVSYLAAELAGASGVLATMTAGLVLGHPIRSRGRLSPAAVAVIEPAWESAAMLANGIVFLGLGVLCALLPWSDGLWTLAHGAIALLVVLVVRAVLVAALVGGFGILRPTLALPLSSQIVLSWGGLRGGLALALALKLPPDLPGRRHAIEVAAIVAVGSLVLGGGTMGPLVRRLRFR